MFVAVYLDDVLVFSWTMEEHLVHLQLVLNRIIQAGLKLKPSKCHFVKQEVRYLGHTITPAGLKPNDAYSCQRIPITQQYQGVATNP